MSRDEIQERIARFHNRARGEKIVVVVWGPGESDEKGYKKRLKIQDEIAKHFEHAKVYFSEDIDEVEMPNATNLLTGAVHAYVADVVIALDKGRGVHLEIDRSIENFRWIRDKLFILTNKEHINSGGLTDELYDKLSSTQLMGFTTKQFDECAVATKMAIEAVQIACTRKILKKT